VFVLLACHVSRLSDISSLRLLRRLLIVFMLLEHLFQISPQK